MSLLTRRRRSWRVPAGLLLDRRLGAVRRSTSMGGNCGRRSRRWESKNRSYSWAFKRMCPAVLGRTDIVVHASTHGEPFGQVVMEGMAAGKPVVATDGGALPEIVENGVTGLLTPMGDAGRWPTRCVGCWPTRARRGRSARRASGRPATGSRSTQTAAKVEAIYDFLLELAQKPRPVHSAPALETTMNGYERRSL